MPSLRDRGLTVTPKLADGDGALGLPGALAEVYPTTAAQQCWIHKTANVVDKLPKRLQARAKSHLHEIWQLDTRHHAEQAFKRLVATYDDDYPKATAGLQKDRVELLAFYEWPGCALAKPADPQSGRIHIRHDCRRTEAKAVWHWATT